MMTATGEEPRQATVGADGPRRHQFLTLTALCLSRLEAEERVLSAIRAYGVTESRTRIKAHGLTFKSSEGIATRLAFAQLVDEARRSGVVPKLDHDMWLKKTPHRTLAYSSDASAFTGTLSTGIRTSAEAKMPGRATNDVVAEMLEDILFYRREAVRLSIITENAYKDCFRAYRAHVGSCITAIDAFINKRIWFAVNDPVRAWTADERKKALRDQYLPPTRKLEKWLPSLSGGRMLDKSSPAWFAYDKIREARNGYVHVNEPDYVFSLRDAADGLNLCREGVGQLLMDVVELFGEYPHPSILAMRYAAVASFAEMPAGGST